MGINRNEGVLLILGGIGYMGDGVEPPNGRALSESFTERRCGRSFPSVSLRIVASAWPGWRNGSRGRPKPCCSCERVGSNPTPGTWYAPLISTDLSTYLLKEVQLSRWLPFRAQESLLIGR